MSKNWGFSNKTISLIRVPILLPQSVYCLNFTDGICIIYRFECCVLSLDDSNCCLNLNRGKYVSVKLSWDFQHLTWESLVEGIPLRDILCLSPKFPSFDYFGKVHLDTKSQIIYVFYSLAQNPGQFKFPFRRFNPKHINSA